MCVSGELCSYNQRVWCLFLLLAVLCWRRRRLSRLCLCFRLYGSRARWRCIHKDFICYPKTDLLPLVHVQVVGPLIRLIFPKPNLLGFIAAAVAKDNSAPLNYSCCASIQKQTLNNS